MIILEKEEQKAQMRWPEAAALLAFISFSKSLMALGHQVSLDMRAKAQALDITKCGFEPQL